MSLKFMMLSFYFFFFHSTEVASTASHGSQNHKEICYSQWLVVLWLDFAQDCTCSHYLFLYIFRIHNCNQISNIKKIITVYFSWKEIALCTERSPAVFLKEQRRVFCHTHKELNPSFFFLTVTQSVRGC